MSSRAISGMICAAAVLVTGCDAPFRNDHHDNSPTSGMLTVYCDEGLFRHIENHAFTFTSQYAAASIDVVAATDEQAVQALWNDSCEAIVISRKLTSAERALFAKKRYDPKSSHVATSGICLIVNSDSPLRSIAAQELGTALTNSTALHDSSGRAHSLRVVIDRDNSSVMRYLQDSVLRGKSFGEHCSSAGSTTAVINYVADNANALGVVDFAWLSDGDDSLVRANAGKIRILGLRTSSGEIVYPSQTGFRTGSYPFARPVYLLRKTGEFSLAKGFQTFVAGPKGQLTFLKQGLLPARQGERNIVIHVGDVQGSER